MPRYIDADELINFIDARGTGLGITVANRCNFKEIVSMIPTADAVAVVRCKDCKYWTGKDYDGCCIKNGLATRFANDFCSNGENKKWINF